MAHIYHTICNGYLGARFVCVCMFRVFAYALDKEVKCFSEDIQIMDFSVAFLGLCWFIFLSTPFFSCGFVRTFLLRVCRVSKPYLPRLLVRCFGGNNDATDCSGLSRTRVSTRTKGISPARNNNVEMGHLMNRTYSNDIVKGRSPLSDVHLARASFREEYTRRLGSSISGPMSNTFEGNASVIRRDNGGDGRQTAGVLRHQSAFVGVTSPGRLPLVNLIGRDQRSQRHLHNNTPTTGERHSPVVASVLMQATSANAGWVDSVCRPPTIVLSDTGRDKNDAATAALTIVAQQQQQKSSSSECSERKRPLTSETACDELKRMRHNSLTRQNRSSSRTTGAHTHEANSTNCAPHTAPPSDTTGKRSLEHLPTDGAEALLTTHAGSDGGGKRQRVSLPSGKDILSSLSSSAPRRRKRRADTSSSQLNVSNEHEASGAIKRSANQRRSPAEQAPPTRRRLAQPPKDDSQLDADGDQPMSSAESQADAPISANQSEASSKVGDQSDATLEEPSQSDSLAVCDLTPERAAAPCDVIVRSEVTVEAFCRDRQRRLNRLLNSFKGKDKTASKPSTASTTSSAANNETSNVIGSSAAVLSQSTAVSTVGGMAPTPTINSIGSPAAVANQSAPASPPQATPTTTASNTLRSTEPAVVGASSTTGSSQLQPRSTSGSGIGAPPPFPSFLSSAPPPYQSTSNAVFTAVSSSGSVGGGVVSSSPASISLPTKSLTSVETVPAVVPAAAAAARTTAATAGPAVLSFGASPSTVGVVAPLGGTATATTASSAGFSFGSGAPVAAAVGGAAPTAAVFSFGSSPTAGSGAPVAASHGGTAAAATFSFGGAAASAAPAAVSAASGNTAPFSFGSAAPFVFNSPSGGGGGGETQNMAGFSTAAAFGLDAVPGGAAAFVAPGGMAEGGLSFGSGGGNSEAGQSGVMRARRRRN